MANLGPEFIVNTTTVSDQMLPTIAALPDGRFVVTWVSFDGADGHGTLIRARLFNADGSPVGNDFQVNSTTANDQFLPSVTALPDGRFVIAYFSMGVFPDQLILARLFNADGSPVANDFQVNSTTTGSHSHQTITTLPDGHFVVTWTSTEDGNGSPELIRARLFTAAGIPVANDFVVSTTPGEPLFSPTIAALPDGHFVVTWQSFDGGVGSYDIRARLFNADGTPVANDFVVNSTTTSNQTVPTVTGLTDGHFVVTWQSQDNGDGSGTVIRAAVQRQRQPGRQRLRGQLHRDERSAHPYDHGVAGRAFRRDVALQ